VENSKTKMNKIITIVGTNASGKSSVGLELAKKYNGEIISADSRQIFRGYDLCSGKVTDKERERVKHHLLDIVDVGDYFSLSDYQSLAYKEIDNIINRNKTPFLVGGTGLYINSVVYGYNLVDAGPDNEIREQLDLMTSEEIIDLIKEKEGNVPDFIDINNKKRLIRAGEIILLGKSLSETRANIPQYQSLQIGVTWDISVVRQRIEERLKTRLEQGMIDEVKKGIESGIDYNIYYNLGLEYRFIAQYLNNEFDGFNDFYEKLKIAIGQFAKKQMTWFRKDKTIKWLNMDDNYIKEASNLIDSFLSK
jgi:tRNA dimethylallyltransferase